MLCTCLAVHWQMSYVLASKVYGENCQSDSECVTNLCQFSNQTCGGPKYYDYGIEKSRQQLYIHGKCHSRIH